MKIDYFRALLKRFNKYKKFCEIKSEADIRKIPFSTKEDLIKFDIADCPERPYYINSTTGSTGKSALLYHSYKSYDMHLQRTAELFRIIGLDYNDIFLNLFLYELNACARIIEDSLKKLKVPVISFGNIEEQRKIKMLLKLLRTCKPTAVGSYVNQAFFFFNTIGKNYAINKSILIGEMLLPEFRKRLEKISGTKIYNLYGCTEFSGIAITERPDDEWLRVVDDDLYIEILRKDGSVGETGKGKIIVTDLFNYSMPMIRYILGDEVEIRRRGDKKYIKLFGRVDNYINIHGELENKSYIIEHLFRIFGHPNFFLVIDKDKKTYKDVIVLNIPRNEPLDDKTIKNKSEEKFNFSFRIRRTSLPVPKTLSGKYRHIVDFRRMNLKDKKLGW